MIRPIDKAVDMDFLWLYATVIAPLYFALAGLGIYCIAIFMTRKKP